MSALRIVGLLCLAVQLLAPQRIVAAEVPEFFGVYISVNGELVELKANPGGGLRGFSIGGADLLRSLSGIVVETAEVEFIVYKQGAAAFTTVPLRRIARVANEIDPSQRTSKPIQNAWYATDKGFNLRVAPLPQNPNMMIRAALPVAGKLSPGYWALDLGDQLYDFAVGPNPHQSSQCLDRILSFAGARYQPCGEVSVGTRSSTREEESTGRDTGNASSPDSSGSPRGARRVETISERPDVVWEALLDFFKSYKGVEADREAGTIQTASTRKGIPGFPSYLTYAVQMEAEGSSTTRLTIDLSSWYWEEMPGTSRKLASSPAAIEGQINRFLKKLNKRIPRFR